MQLQHFLNLNENFGLVFFLFFPFKSENNYNYIIDNWMTSTIITGTVPEDIKMTKVENFSLSQNYPNPFNPSTRITYSIQKAGFVSLKVYDILGREVATLVNGYQQANQYSVTFNASNLASGIYLYKLKAGDYVQTRKMLLLK